MKILPSLVAMMEIAKMAEQPLNVKETKQVSLGIQLPPKQWAKKRARTKMQKKSRRINRTTK